MVYEDAYNYYVFNVPKNITEVEIFITTLSGEAKLVTSSIYNYPETIFTYLQGNDIKVNPKNIIKFKTNELKDKIYIGVYGASIA